MDIYASVRDLDWDNPLIVTMARLFVVAMILATICLILALTGRTGRQHRALLVFAGLSALVLTTGFGLAIHVVHKARQAFLDSYLVDEGPLWYESINTIEPVLSAVGWALGGFSLLGASTLGTLIRRSPEIRTRMPIGLFFSCFLLSFITALGIGLRLSHIGTSPPISALTDPGVQWAINHGDQVLTVARRSVLGIAIFATIVILVQTFLNQSMTRDSFGSSGWSIGIFFAAIGTHAWLTTRPLAFDAREPLPLPPGGPLSLCPEMTMDAAKLPRATTEDAPFRDLNYPGQRFHVLEFDSTGTKLFGRSVQDPAELERFSDRKVTPGVWAAGQLIVVAADASLPATNLAPWLAVIPKSASVRFLRLYEDHVPRQTHTAGIVPRKPRCACRPVDHSSP